MPYYGEREKAIEYLLLPTDIDFHSHYNFTPKIFSHLSIEFFEKLDLKKEDLIEIQFISTDFKEIYHIPCKYINDFEKFISSANLEDLPSYESKKFGNDVFFEIPGYLEIKKQREIFLNDGF
ncbi:hypothetical protein DLH72_00865 [Candidatus Gracilibacteria bacterium]|nr:MAG: hypothetical protein DLH72_00865 [Candidatus Gracilibacteria bacterium]